MGSLHASDPLPCGERVRVRAVSTVGRRFDVRARPAGVRAAAGPRARPSRPGRGPVRRSTDRDAIIGPGALSMYVPLPRRPSRARRAFELNYKNGCAAGAAPEHHRVAFSQKTRFLPHPRWNTGREASEINRQREISACAKR